MCKCALVVTFLLYEGLATLPLDIENILLENLVNFFLHKLLYYKGIGIFYYIANIHTYVY